MLSDSILDLAELAILAQKWSKIALKKLIFGSLRTILLWIVGELAGVGSGAVAVGVSDMWNMTGDMQHVLRNRWHVTCDTQAIWKRGNSIPKSKLYWGAQSYKNVWRLTKCGPGHQEGVYHIGASLALKRSNVVTTEVQRQIKLKLCLAVKLN